MSKQRVRVLLATAIVVVLAGVGVGISFAVSGGGSSAGASGGDPRQVAESIVERLDASDLLTASALAASESGLSGADATFDVVITPGTETKGPKSGILLFNDAKALQTWVQLSKSLDGVAVVGKDWAVSLPSTPVELGLAMAPEVQRVLGGQIER